MNPQHPALPSRTGPPSRNGAPSPKRTTQCRRWCRRSTALALGAALALAAALAPVAGGQARATAADPAAKHLTVDLSTPTKKSEGVGLGILYGVTQDGQQPADEYLDPLNLNAFRGGGWYTGGWLRDNYAYGNATKGNIDAVIAIADRLQQPPRHKVEYQVLLSDVWGSTGGAPVNAQWPCGGGDCSNWIEFLDEVVPRLEASDHDFVYEPWNEPDLAIFWRPGVNTDQYFQMWDTAFHEIRRLAPDAKIAGPSFAFTPERNPGEWQTFMEHAKAAGTVPDIVTNHDEGDIDDPVTVGDSLEKLLSDNGIGERPLSANEYQPAGRQTAGDTAWYLARLAQSDYSSAMRGNWSCCIIPNLTGLLSNTPTGWAPNGNWWAMRAYADMTGRLVATSAQVDSTAVSASVDPSAKRAVALIGDIRGAFTGSTAVTFDGLSAAPYVVRSGSVHATVYRIPDESPLYAPEVVANDDIAVQDGSITVPFDFQEAHDSYAVYLSPTGPHQVSVDVPDELEPGGTYTVPVTFHNGGLVDDRKVMTALSMTSSDGTVDGARITCAGSTATCSTIATVGAGQSVVDRYEVQLPADLQPGNYRFTATASGRVLGQTFSVKNAADVLQPCTVGVVCEAEYATLAGGACVAGDHPGYTGAGFVACLTRTGPSITQEVRADAAGSYTMQLRYAAGPDGPSGTRTTSVTVNGGAPQQVELPLTGSWNTWGTVTVPVQLTAGPNTITVSNRSGDTGWYNLDHLLVTS